MISRCLPAVVLLASLALTVYDSQAVYAATGKRLLKTWEKRSVVVTPDEPIEVGAEWPTNARGGVAEETQEVRRLKSLGSPEDGLDVRRYHTNLLEHGGKHVGLYRWTLPDAKADKLGLIELVSSADKGAAVSTGLRAFGAYVIRRPAGPPMMLLGNDGTVHANYGSGFDGAVTSSHGTLVNDNHSVDALRYDHLFHGGKFDSQTGLHLIGRRYYWPDAGRFISADPIGAWGDEHAHGDSYLFAGGNPSAMTDQDGQAAHFLAGLAVSGIVGNILEHTGLVDTAVGGFLANLVSWPHLAAGTILRVDPITGMPDTSWAQTSLRGLGAVAVPFAPAAGLRAHRAYRSYRAARATAALRLADDAVESVGGLADEIAALRRMGARGRATRGVAGLADLEGIVRGLGRELDADAATVLAGVRQRAAERGDLGLMAMADEAEEVIHRLSRVPESRSRLARKAAEGAEGLAEAGHPAIHGVSAFPGAPRLRGAQAVVQELTEAGFPVHRTPLPNLPEHLTVELPNPVTPEVARLWNQIWRNVD